VHAVVVPCSAEGGEAAEEGEGGGLREVQVVAGDFGDDGEAALKERERGLVSLSLEHLGSRV